MKPPFLLEVSPHLVNYLEQVAAERGLDLQGVGRIALLYGVQKMRDKGMGGLDDRSSQVEETHA